jgi:hypothetical protein
MRRLVATLALVLLVMAVLPAVGLAVDDHDAGQGTYGEADDKVVTNAGFLVIAFFPRFIAAMSALQWGLDRRKQRRKKHLPDADWAGGW